MQIFHFRGERILTDCMILYLEGGNKHQARGLDTVHESSLSNPCDNWDLPATPSASQLESYAWLETALLKEWC